jgi:oligopeptide/dipeptide ABC transporter ATP-binding protein
MSDILLACNHLKKYFPTPAGYLHAVDDINLTIPRGKTLGIVGESGCGKSTLGRCILRLIEPTSGEVLFDGRDVTKMDQKELHKMRREMQLIFQDPYASLNPRKTVFQTISEPMRIYGICKDKADLERRTLELMDTVGLSDRYINTYPHEIDGGRRQRIGIARALSLDPKFVVCDEPVSALDVSIQAQILNLMMDLQDKMGLTYMFITHNLSVVKHISDEIAVLYLGQMVERAPRNELFSNPAHPYTQALLSAIPIPALGYKDKEPELIRGEVSSPINPKPGCRFAPRCPYATNQCQEEQPMRDLGNGHIVACHRCGGAPANAGAAEMAAG